MKDVKPDDMLATVFSSLFKSAGVDPSTVDDIFVGNVLMPGSGHIPARMAALSAGIPERVPLATVNRQCSSGIQAIANAAASLKAGYAEVAIGAGFESMSHFDMMGSVNMDAIGEKAMENDAARDCLTPMGMTSENVAEEFGVSRREQDRAAYLSHQRADKAKKSRAFDGEIVPVQTEDGVVTEDDGVRPSVTEEKLSRLPTVFKEDGTTTAGNASQVSDGAAAALLMTRRKAKELGVKPIGRFVDYVVAGVPPRIMGIGPAVAIPKLLARNGMKVEDIDVFEINEAFASQYVYCLRKLGISVESDKVNPNGGAIALGHPLGCTGARQLATLLNTLKKRGGKYGVISMCIGTGMGAAALIQAE
uniref:acetyl-CoA C-acyltransferase n=1 Tax=Palpitomonas bilix TaxID=652834 RepID=A0A7S3CWW3_9EUKA